MSQAPNYRTSHGPPKDRAPRPVRLPSIHPSTPGLIAKPNGRCKLSVSMNVPSAEPTLSRPVLWLVIAVVVLVTGASRQAETLDARALEPERDSPGIIAAGLDPNPLPSGAETTALAIQNAGDSATDVTVEYFDREGSPVGGADVTFSAVPEGGNRIAYRHNNTNLPTGFDGYGVASASEPLASVLVRETTEPGADSNHSYSIVNTPTEGAPTFALPILLANFGTPRWNGNIRIQNLGTETACVRVFYFITRTLTDVAVGSTIVDSPTGQPGCPSGYSVTPGQLLLLGGGTTPDFPFHPDVLNTQSGGLVEVINDNGNNDIAVSALLFRSDGSRMMAGYDGFAVRPDDPDNDDVGTEVVIPLAIKWVSGWYSVIGAQNLGNTPADINIRYVGNADGNPVDVTVTLDDVEDVWFDSSYDPASPLPMNFVGYAVLTSTQPIAGLLVRAKWLWSDNSTNEPTYTAVNGTPRANAAKKWALPLIYRRYEKLTPSSIGMNSWLQVQVADGSDAEVTIRFVGIPGEGCPTGPFETTSTVSGSKVFYMNLDADNGFPNDNQPECFVGSATVSADEELFVIGQVSDDRFVSSDNEALYPAIDIAKIPSPPEPEPEPEPEPLRIVAGHWSTCVYTPEQPVECWHPDGVLDTEPDETKRFLQLSIGEWHACGMLTDGSFECWGLQQPSMADQTPEGPFTLIDAVGFNTCGIEPGGTLDCWGLGAIPLLTPPVGVFTDVAVSPWGQHACALGIDQTVTCWGEDDVGQASAPPELFMAISAGLSASCGIRIDGTIECWGTDELDLLDPPSGTFTKIDLGSTHGCALRSDGTLACWGDVSGSGTPIETPPEGKFVGLASGLEHACALTEDEKVECWGGDFFNQLKVPDHLKPASGD